MTVVSDSRKLQQLCCHQMIMMEQEDQSQSVHRSKCWWWSRLYLGPVFNAANAVALVTMTFMVRAFPTTRLGFFCGDTSIRYPLLPSGESVTTSKALAFTLIIAIFIFCLGEYLAAAFQSRRKNSHVSSNNVCNNSNNSSPNKAVSPLKSWLLCAGGWWRRSWTAAAARTLVVFLWGVGVGHLVCYVLKSSFGTLRPHFWAVCRPNVTCTGDAVMTYHEDYVCQGASEREEARARQSFPSGHATFAGYSAMFLVIYVQQRLRPRHMGGTLAALRPFLQVVLWSLSLWVCATRVTDHVHHLGDVVAGYILGGVIGLVLAYQTLMCNKDCSNKTSDDTGSIRQQQQLPANCLNDANKNTNHVDEQPAPAAVATTAKPDVDVEKGE